MWGQSSIQIFVPHFIKNLTSKNHVTIALMSVAVTLFVHYLTQLFDAVLVVLPPIIELFSMTCHERLFKIFIKLKVPFYFQEFSFYDKVIPAQSGQALLSVQV